MKIYQMFEDDPDKARMTVWNELQRDEAMMAGVREKLEEYYRLYRLSRDAQDHPYNRDVMLPVVRSEVLIRCARLVAGPLRSERPCTVDPSDDVTPIESAEAMEDLIGEQWKDKRSLNGTENAIRLAKTADMGGVAWAMVGWRFDRRIVSAPQQVVDPMTGQPMEIPGQEEIEFDGPALIVPHLSDCWPDVRRNTESEFGHFYMREEVAPDDLRGRVEGAGYDEEVVEEAINAAPSDIRGGGSVANMPVGEDRFSLFDKADLPRPSDDYEGDEAPVYIFHRFSKGDWVTLSSSGKMMWGEDEPWPDGEIPILGFRPEPDLQSPVGVPQVEGSAGMNKLLNITASQMNEFAARVIDPVYLVRHTSPFRFAQIKNAPGEFWPVADPTDVTPAKKDPGTAPIGMDYMAFLKYYADVGGQTSDFQRAIGSGGLPDTAFGIGKFTEQQDVRFGLTFTLFMQFWNRIFEKVGKFNQMLLEKEQWVKRVGRDGVKGPLRAVTPELLQGAFKYNTDASTSRLNPDQHFQAISAFVNVFGPTGAITPALPYLARQAAETIGIRDPGMASPYFVARPLSVEEEGMLLDMGLDIPTNPGDNPLEHIDFHKSRLLTQQSLNPDIEMAHLQMHIQQLNPQFAPAAEEGGGRGADTGPDAGGSPAKRSARKQQAEGGKGPPGMAPSPTRAPGRTQ